jgi:hypothetical protein
MTDTVERVTGRPASSLDRLLSEIHHERPNEE